MGVAAVGYIWFIFLATCGVDLAGYKILYMRMSMKCSGMSIIGLHTASIAMKS